MALAETALLRIPGFGRFASVASLDALAFSGEQVVLGWLVLDLTNSPLLVGVALALRVVPMLVVGLPAGVLADRGDRSSCFAPPTRPSRSPSPRSARSRPSAA